jgi:hypothetical protein
VARPARVAVVALALVAVAAPARGTEGARAAVEGLVARLAAAGITDVVVDQRVTVYHPNGRLARATGEQHVVIQAPGRLRVEQVLEGAREVRVTVGARTWLRSADGKITEVPTESDPARGRTAVLTLFRRSADDILAEWRALGVRTDESHGAQVRGRTVTVIGSTKPDRESPAVWIDPEYGVVRFIARERTPDGPRLVDLTFSEHRPLGPGVFFPYRQEVFANGRLVLLITVHAARINTHPPETLFDPEALRRER